MGIAQNQVDTWSFIQIFDISELIDEFHLVHKFYLQIKTTIKNASETDEFNKELKNYYHIINNLEDKIQTQIYQLNPLLTHRAKRGIIDGLGSIIKSITGNLDQNDAQRYDRAISTLTDNQGKIKTLEKNQISLLENSIQKFQHDTKIITHNQVVLRDRIIELENVVKTTQGQNVKTYQYITFEIVVSQLTATLRTMYDMLERIENAVTFSKLNTFHNSILEPKELLTELQKVNEYLNPKIGKFPFEVSLQNILFFEKIMKIKCYSKGNQINFILEVPIVEIENYNLYHLYSLPILSHNTFKTIIPHSKYFLLNEQNFALFDLQCQEITSEEFLCRDRHISRITADAPCEVQLLKYTRNITNCLQVQVDISEVKIQQLEKSQWIVVAPNDVVATQKCGNNKDNVLLNGTYVIEISSECEVLVKDTLLKTYQNVKPKFKKIALPELYFDFKLKTTNDVYNPKKLEIASINLDETKNIINALNDQKQELNRIEEVPIHFNKISFWTIMIYILIAFAALYTIYRYLMKKKPSGTTTSQAEEIRLGIRDINSTLNG